LKTEFQKCFTRNQHWQNKRTFTDPKIYVWGVLADWIQWV